MGPSNTADAAATHSHEECICHPALTGGPLCEKAQRLTLLHDRREQRAVSERLALEDNTLTSTRLLQLRPFADGRASVAGTNIEGDSAAKGRLDEDLDAIR